MNNTKILNSSIIVIKGENKIYGEIDIPGDKVSAVHLLLATLISNKKTRIDNIPLCGDVISILTWIKVNNIADINYAKNYVEIKPNQNQNFKIDLFSISQNRASICLVTAMALKFGEVIFTPNIGGCDFTSRKIDRHLDLIRAFGITIRKEIPDFVAVKTNNPKKVEFDCSTKFGASVGITCHALIAALVFNREIILHNIAIESAPAILVKFFEIITNRTILVNGNSIIIKQVKTMNYNPVEISLPYDLTVVCTYIAAGMANGGNIYLKRISNSIPSVANLLDKMNIKYFLEKEGIEFQISNIIHPGYIECIPWPGFPSDIGPIFAAGLCMHKGQTKLIDRVYDKRSSHIAGLNKMG
ncbi:MAG: hypothetical protein U9O55_01100 [Patescibacteria group bacterium]|nr:hypothetical protein [Patescibacteria group bacterium]